MKKGDRHADPLELIVRRVVDGREFREETVFRIVHTESVDAKAIEAQVDEAIRNLFKTQAQLKSVLPAFQQGYFLNTTTSRPFVQVNRVPLSGRGKAMLKSAEVLAGREHLTCSWTSKRLKGGRHYG